ncbi:Cleft lip and palate associated transmembrane protein 1 [Bulinus truncatus]|nr:Cleft lip and palate associated transmembrane protein 1 [Bulinus truncatus]
MGPECYHESSLTALSTFQAMTSSNYDRFATAVSGEITQQLEKAVTKTTFNRLGGLQFDKELRSLVGYLSSVTTWTVRDKFSRLMQMATIFKSREGIKISLHTDIYSSGSESGPLTHQLTPDGKFYYPSIFINELGYRIKDLLLIDKTSTVQPLTIVYSPISLGKMRLWINIGQSFKMLKDLGFTEKDTDEIKGIFLDTNFYLLLLTFTVAAFHLLFDFLAFKNDIMYWQSKKTMVGLSTRAVIWRCISTGIIFLYLMDENTSLLVLIPTGIGVLIELWKVTKALKIKVHFNGLTPKFHFEDSTEKEKETETFDSEAMKYLSYLLYPLCIGGALYSLLYVQHKSWYSWSVMSLVNGVYAFGFLFMLPQLFVNYKLKSVAHLPWKAFMYKAFNTFIDDIFAFIITMPTAHRLACFRDDVVFIIYLYQRWLYPVDKKRANEYGISYTEEDSVTQELKKSK